MPSAWEAQSKTLESRNQPMRSPTATTKLVSTCSAVLGGCGVGAGFGGGCGAGGQAPRCGSERGARPGGWQGPAGPRCFCPVLQLSHVKGGISSAVTVLSSGTRSKNVLRER